jgi:hypothetical protein
MVINNHQPGLYTARLYPLPRRCVAQPMSSPHGVLFRIAVLLLVNFDDSSFLLKEPPAGKSSRSLSFALSGNFSGALNPSQQSRRFFIVQCFAGSPEGPGQCREPHLHKQCFPRAGQRHRWISIDFLKPIAQSVVPVGWIERAPFQEQLCLRGPVKSARACAGNLRFLVFNINLWHRPHRAC